MATDLERLVVQLSADIKRYENALNRARGVTNRQAQAIETRFAKMNRSISSGFGQFGRGFIGGVAGAFGIDQVRRFADAWTEAGNRLEAASAISGKQARSLQDLNKIANETRTSISATAELYAKLLTSTANVAKSEEEVARATELVNKAFKAGGASASEQAAGILQLSQALGSGVLQGDELRSLRENAPLLAKAIADEFGVAVAGLKELGSQGKLTSDRVFKAILSGANDINKAFAATDATIGDSFTRLSNSLQQLVGALDKASGFTPAFAAEVNRLADALDRFSQHGGLDNFLAIFDIKLVEGGLADSVRDLFTGMSESAQRSADEISAEIADLEKRLEELTSLAAAGFEVGADTDRAQQELRELRAELNNVGASADAATAAIEGLAKAVENIPADPRAAGFRFLSESAANQTGARKLFEDRDAETRRTEDQRELDRRTQDVMRAAEQAGVELTEGAARIQAASEIAAENLQRTTTASVGSASELIKRFEGFRSTPYFDVNAMRAGFGSDTVTLSDGSIQKVTRGITVSLADANRDLERRIGEFQNTIEGQIGQNTFRGMTEEQQAALTSIAYNYGSLPQRIVEAIKTGNVETITNAIRGLGGDNGGINRNRRNQEADIFLGGAPEALQEDINLRRQQQEIIQQTMASLQQENAAIGLQTSLIGASNAERERQTLIFETLNALQAQGITITDELRAQVEAEAAARYGQVAAYDQATAATDRLAQAQQELAYVGQEISGAFQGAIKSFISDLVHGKDATEALSDAVAQLADRLLDIALNQIFSSLFGGFGGIGGGLFGGGLFARGGYTGNMPANKAAGVVHGREFVVNAEATKRHRGLLEAINGGMPGYAEGGFVLPKLGGPGGQQARMPAPNVMSRTTVVNTFDAGSFLSEALSRQAGVNVILNAVRSQPGAFRQAMQGG